MYSATSSWRWGAWVSIVIAGISFILVLATYHPPTRSSVGEMTKKETALRIDFIGGVLSVSGTGVFLAGLQLAGYNLYIQLSLFPDV
jgi:Fungal trichothecene efflux pump (TRI12)